MSTHNATDEVIRLAALLGPFDDIKRATKLPSGSYESDSHHAFSLAVIAYTVASKYCPELDQQKVMKFALVHDLLELITGDEPTLHHTHEQHAAKKAREEEAIKDFKQMFDSYATITEDLDDYERLDSPEAAFVYVLDKACTVWTHFFDAGTNLRDLGILKRADIDIWYERLQSKIAHNLKCEPPKITYEVLEQSFARMRTELLSD
jgi:5'-deoxynucleotidase YfbR-like HD superfamily hydrolase